MDWNAFLSGLGGFWFGCCLIGWFLAHAKFERLPSKTLDEKFHATIVFWVTFLFAPLAIAKVLSRLTPDD